MKAKPGPQPALPLLLISGLAVLATGEPEKPQLSIEHHGASGQVGLQWQAEPDAVYLLRHKADLLDVEWTGKYGMQGTGASHTATLDAAGSRGFYRVERHDLSSAALALDPDRDTISTLLEVLGGTNPFLNRDANTNLLPDDWEAYRSGEIAAFPPMLRLRLDWGGTEEFSLMLNNPTSVAATYTATVEGLTAEGYRWEDSATGAAVYQWNDIAGTGTRMAAISDVDTGSEKITLEQFTFPYYGREYTELWVSSNGYVNFRREDNEHRNDKLPDYYLSLIHI